MWFTLSLKNLRENPLNSRETMELTLLWKHIKIQTPTRTNKIHTATKAHENLYIEHSWKSSYCTWKLRLLENSYSHKNIWKFTLSWESIRFTLLWEYVIILTIMKFFFWHENTLKFTRKILELTRNHGNHTAMKTHKNCKSQKNI